MKKSEQVLTQKKCEMTFEQVGQILALSDNIGAIQFRTSQKWLERSRTKAEADYLIKKLCNLLDGVYVEQNRMRCSECDWEGEERDLALKTSRSGFSEDNVCPKCGTNEHLVDFGDDDRELAGGFSLIHLG